MMEGIFNILGGVSPPFSPFSDHCFGFAFETEALFREWNTIPPPRSHRDFASAVERTIQHSKAAVRTPPFTCFVCGVFNNSMGFTVTLVILLIVCHFGLVDT